MANADARAGGRDQANGEGDQDDGQDHHKVEDRRPRLDEVQGFAVDHANADDDQDTRQGGHGDPG
jgi:hypothetical protein